MDTEIKFPGSHVEQQDKIKIPRLNILLFIVTFLTTYIIGGFYYSLTIMTILLAHELGHYFTCRAYKVPATVPFFIPVPLPPFGTFGAVIKMQGIIPNRRALFDIGVAGPIMGLVFTIPAIFIGLEYSNVISGGLPEGSVTLGESLLFRFLSELVKGKLPDNMDIMLHPVAFAGWAGLFVTALNLLPIGQLDGGHVVYAIFGRTSRWIYRIGIVALTFITLFINSGWLLLLILVILFARKHPQTLYDDEPLGIKRVLVGIVMIAIFFISFTPVPIKLGNDIEPVGLIFLKILRSWIGF